MRRWSVDESDKTPGIVCVVRSGLHIRTFAGAWGAGDVGNKASEFLLVLLSSSSSAYREYADNKYFHTLLVPISKESHKIIGRIQNISTCQKMCCVTKWKWYQFKSAICSCPSHKCLLTYQMTTSAYQIKVPIQLDRLHSPHLQTYTYDNLNCSTFNRL